MELCCVCLEVGGRGLSELFVCFLDELKSTLLFQGEVNFSELLWYSEF